MPSAPLPSIISCLDRDPDLLHILDELRTITLTLHTPEHPHSVMMLLQNERLKRNQGDFLMNDLIGRYGEDYTILVHNSDAMPPRCTPRGATLSAQPGFWHAKKRRRSG